MVVMPPMTSCYSENGYVTDGMINYYAARAKGGTGLVIVEDCIIDTPLGRHGYTDTYIDDDKYIGGLGRLAEAIKACGARAGIQLNHGGRMAGRLRDGQLVMTAGETPVAPSAIAYPFPGFGAPRELSVAELETIEDKFAEGARRARDAGFDLISIHCSHQYLVEQSLSPLSNQRQDEYGGSFENRLCFLLEIIRKTKQKVGGDFPLICRVSGMEYIEGGLTVDDARMIAKRLESAGIYALNVSHGANPGGLSENSVKPLTESPKSEQRGELVHLAVPIKEVVSIPVMTVGRIVTPDLAEEIISQGKADMVCIGRGLITDPEWAKKADEGRESEIRHCIGCESCFASTDGSPLQCAINPAAGNEEAYRLTKAEKSKNIIIAGGGSAGMEAARVAAGRGHRVTLYERDKLGGQLSLSCLPPGKDEFVMFLEFERGQLEKLGVSIKNEELDYEIIAREEPDAVIIATGARPLKPAIPGIEGENVVTAWQVLGGGMPAGKKTVVIGGGVTGCETAEMLAVNGNWVTIVEMLDAVAGDAVDLPFYHLALLKTLKLLEVEILTGTTVKEITESGIVVESGGRRSTIEADVVVLSLGVEPDNTLAEQLKGSDIEMYVVGDCDVTGKLPEAVRAGFLAGLAV
jgi:2,4-dienoyl-CoA reductase-like NADH-dependent reductase (Old Yellow Enzyme family)/thioredoxin reductase